MDNSVDLDKYLDNLNLPLDAFTHTNKQIEGTQPRRKIFTQVLFLKHFA